MVFGVWGLGVGDWRLRVGGKGLGLGCRVSTLKFCTRPRFPTLMRRLIDIGNLGPYQDTMGSIPRYAGVCAKIC